MIEDETALAKEVTEVYLALAQQQIKCEIFTDRFESASLAAEIDSMKLLDGVASEEDWLLSASNRLDAQLALFDAENSLSEMKRQFAILLDRDPETEFTLHVPPVGDHIDSLEREQMLQTWDRSLPVAKAELEYTKADRAAEHAASGHGLNGDLNVDYSTGQGQVTTQGLEEKIVTRGWSVSLDFTFPLWDGGASKAAVKSAKIAAEQAKLDLSTSKRTTKAEIINLINKLDVSYKRLGIIRQQVDLAQNKLDIAESRYNDGQISRITYLDSEIFYLETRDTYLEELKNYLLDRKELEGKFRNA
jgi:outer membrane protein